MAYNADFVLFVDLLKAMKEAYGTPGSCEQWVLMEDITGASPWVLGVESSLLHFLLLEFLVFALLAAGGFCRLAAATSLSTPPCAPLAPRMPQPGTVAPCPCDLATGESVPLDFKTIAQDYFQVGLSHRVEWLPCGVV